MQNVNWGAFKAKFSGKEQATFEWFCYLLFCIEHGRAYGIARYENHAGIENDPVQVGTNWVGWQAKFYDTPPSRHESELRDAITTAKSRHPELTKVVFYLNRDFGQHPRGTKSAAQSAIEAQATSLGVEVEWRTESYFEAPFVTKENAALASYFFSTGPTVFNLVTGLRQRTEQLLARIRDRIEFNGQVIKLDRSSELATLRQSLDNPTPLIVAGVGGSGKTAAIKELYEHERQRTPVFIFKATELSNLSGATSLFREFGPFSASDFVAAFPHAPAKVVVVDSAEKLADLDDKDDVASFFATLQSHGWKLMFTTRLSYLRDLRHLLVDLLAAATDTVDIGVIPDTDLQALASTYGFSLPADQRMLDLLRNPFYLHDYLQTYDSQSTTLTYANFKYKLWNRKVLNSTYTKDGTHTKRATCFIELAKRRANGGTFFIGTEGLDAAVLNLLAADEIIAFDEPSTSYFVTHDIYEEWALDQLVEGAFRQQPGPAGFYAELGSALAVRRAFRHWLSDKMASDLPSVHSLVVDSLAGDIPRFWRDEVLVSILVSDHAGAFLATVEDRFRADGYALLLRLIFLLRIACKEIDETLLRILSKSGADLSWETVLAVPKGSGWSFVIGYVHRNLADIGLTHANSIIALVDDWNGLHKAGDTTRQAGQIALAVYEAISPVDYSRRNDLESKTIQAVLNAAGELVEEMDRTTAEFVGDGGTHRNRYEPLVRTVLSSFLNGLEAARAVPHCIMSLARSYWFATSPGSDYDQMDDLSHSFGLRERHTEYFPESALQTPMLALLNAHSQLAIDFLVELVNRSAAAYRNSRFGDEVEEITIQVGESGPVKQAASHRLWCAYRGTQVTPHLFTSLHMALETWLLRAVESLPQENAVNLCRSLLSRSASASITSVVASAVFAFPGKLFDVACILFRTPEAFEYDQVRFTHDQTAKSTLLSLRAYGRSEDSMHDQDRLRAADAEHRKQTLEQLAVAYQFVLPGEDSADVAYGRREVIGGILDSYYAAPPKPSEESEQDKVWRLHLARMDVRKWQVSSERRGDDVVVAISPAVDPELEEYQQATLARIADGMEHANLQVWAHYRWDRNASEYEKYQRYEDEPNLALEEVQQLVGKLDARADDERYMLFNHATPAYVCAVLVRDFGEQLDEVGGGFCSDVLLSYAVLPLQGGYMYQASDGTVPAIYVLPTLATLIPNGPELAANALVRLLLAPIDHQISDVATAAVRDHLWPLSHQMAQAIFVTFLHLKDQVGEAWHQHQIRRYSVQPEDGAQADFAETFEGILKPVWAQAKAGATGYADVGDIASLDIHVFGGAFNLLPLGTADPTHKAFVSAILPPFAALLADDRGHNDFDLRHNFTEKLAFFTLSAPEDETLSYIAPVEASICSREYGADLLKDFISAEDQLFSGDRFWAVWEALLPRVVAAVKANGEGHYTRLAVRSYLFASTPWRDGVREWRSLGDRGKLVLQRASEEMGGVPVVLYSLAKALTDIGSGFAGDGLRWIAGMLGRHHNLWTAGLEPNTTYYLEAFVRRFLTAHRSAVRRDAAVRSNVLVILDFLIEQASVYAYVARESIL